MTPIKPWLERVPPETRSFDYPRMCREAEDAEIAELRAALAKSADDPELDCTDGAHPAWWRGHDHTTIVFCKKVNEILDGKDDGHGVSNEPWESTRRRLLALAKSQPVEKGEPVRPMSETTAWLIELNIANAPCWLTGTGAYTNDANEALQFVREIDAKAMLDVYMGAKFGKEIIGIYRRHFAPENYRVTEHIFHGIKGATE